MSESEPALRILYVEDNPLIVFHVQALVEDLGHIFAGSFSSFTEIQAANRSFDDIDGALIDIDLSDGPTGPAVAEWFNHRNIPSIFVTGQEHVAARYKHVSLGIIGKPIQVQQLAMKLQLFKFRGAR
jgi:CheY-like chemotaxis protein